MEGKREWQTRPSLSTEHESIFFLSILLKEFSIYLNGRRLIKFDDERHDLQRKLVKLHVHTNPPNGANSNHEQFYRRNFQKRGHYAQKNRKIVLVPRSCAILRRISCNVTVVFTMRRFVITITAFVMAHVTNVATQRERCVTVSSRGGSQRPTRCVFPFEFKWVGFHS